MVWHSQIFCHPRHKERNWSKIMNTTRILATVLFAGLILQQPVFSQPNAAGTNQTPAVGTTNGEAYAAMVSNVMKMSTSTVVATVVTNQTVTTTVSNEPSPATTVSNPVSGTVVTAVTNETVTTTVSNVAVATSASNETVAVDTTNLQAA